MVLETYGQGFETTNCVYLYLQTSGDGWVSFYAESFWLGTTPLMSTKQRCCVPD